jgi:predicted MFS family arabinose efflux permease
MQPVPSPVQAVGANVWRATLAGLCASLVGIGLARFAYTPLIPVLVTEQWFEPSQAAYLGAANLAGYLVGALGARWMTAIAPVSVVLRTLMLLATASFFACAYPVSFSWFFLCRFTAGVSGGALMVLAALAVLPHVPPSRRGLAGGAIFTGVGLGIVVSGTLVPLLLRFGLGTTWQGLGVVALALTLLAWTGWPNAANGPDTTAQRDESRPRSSAALKALYVEYGLNAVGLVPHMVFLVDFVVRGLGQGLAAGARYWVIFGLGAVLGPMLAGTAADRVGFRPALRLGFLVQAVAVALVVVTDRPLALMLSSAIVGAFVPGVVPLALGRVQELATDDRDRKIAWSWCTAAFALGQAGAAYAFSYVFTRSGGAYLPLFVAGAGALLLALAIDLVWPRAPEAGNQHGEVDREPDARVPN